MADNLKLAWLAGFLDGEGSICIPTDHPRHGLLIRIANTHKPSIVKAAQIGNSKVDNYIYKPKNPKNKDSYSVRWHDHKALLLLKDIFPYLITKREQAKVAFKFMRAMPNKGYGARKLTLKEIRQRESARIAIKVLNKRGKG